MELTFSEMYIRQKQAEIQMQRILKLRELLTEPNSPLNDFRERHEKEFRRVARSGNLGEVRNSNETINRRRPAFSQTRKRYGWGQAAICPLWGWEARR
jgi:hypothetical protein